MDTLDNRGKWEKLRAEAAKHEGISYGEVMESLDPDYLSKEEKRLGIKLDEATWEWLEDKVSPLWIRGKAEFVSRVIEAIRKYEGKGIVNSMIIRYAMNDPNRQFDNPARMGKKAEFPRVNG